MQWRFETDDFDHPQDVYDEHVSAEEYEAGLYDAEADELVIEIDHTDEHIGAPHYGHI